MVFRNKDDGTLSIYDWKRCREIKKTDRKCSKNPVIEHIPDTNYWHYCDGDTFYEIDTINNDEASDDINYLIDVKLKF
jgi:hypothetical protein